MVHIILLHFVYCNRNDQTASKYFRLTITQVIDNRIEQRISIENRIFKTNIRYEYFRHF